MKKLSIFTLIAVLSATIVLIAGPSASGHDKSGARALLTGYSEVPSISTSGVGKFEASYDEDTATVNFKLSYSNLEGTAQAAHIHFGQRGVNGAVVAFLCGGGGKPACPASGTVTGTVKAADIQAVPAQGIEAGNLNEVLRAAAFGLTYVNVHTSKFSGGEIRGQVFAFSDRDGRGHDKHDD